MRKSRVTVLVLASIVSIASQVSAQFAPATRGSARAGNEVGRGGERGRNRKGLFHGVTLNDAEKAKLKEVRQNYRSETQALRGSLAPALKEARVARQKGDTAAARVAFERTKADRGKLRELVQRQTVDIRGALSAENQRKFDENLKRVAQRHQRDGKRGEARGQGKAGRHIGRGRNATNG